MDQRITVNDWMAAALAEMALPGKMKRVKIDPQVGGSFYFSDLRSTGETTHWGTYRALEWPNKLVFTWCVGLETEIDTDPQPSVVSIAIVQNSEGCAVTLIHEMDDSWIEYIPRIKQSWTCMLQAIESTELFAKVKTRTTIAPLLSVRGGTWALDFCKLALGAIVLHQADGDPGSVVAQLSVAGAEFWIADESPIHLNFSPELLAGSTVRMVMTVDDPDAVFHRAISAGATVVHDIADQSYGWRIGRFVDPFGHHWEVCKQLDR